MSHTFDHTQYKDEVEQRWGAPGTLWARSGGALGHAHSDGDLAPLHPGHFR